MTGHNRTQSSSSQSIHPDGAKSGTSWATWSISGAALVIGLTAAALFLGDPNSKTESVKVEEENLEETKTDDVQELIVTPKNPLDIASSYLDAKERALLWESSAVLSGIELVVTDGKPSGAIAFEFGAPIGPAVPGAILGAKRYSVSYDGENISANAFKSTQRKISLPEPGCPLEVAYRALVASEGSSPERVGIMDLQSKKYGRPVWFFATSGGKDRSINGQSCALLRR